MAEHNSMTNAASGGQPSNGFPPGASAPGNGYSNGGMGYTQPFAQPQLAVQSSDGFVQILGRQWHVVIFMAVAAVMLSVIYLMITRPVYTSSAKLRVEPMGSQMISTNANDAGGGGGGEISADFLATECDVVTSNPVLALALGKLSGVKSISGAEYPIDYLKSKLSADVAKKGQTIDVTYDSTNSQEANQVVQAVIEAYQSFESDHWKNKVKDSLGVLETGKAKQQQELDAKTQRMLELATKYGFTNETDPDKNPLREQVRTLSEEVTKAHLETINAKNAYDEAGKAIVGKPDMIAAVQAAESQSAYSANPAVQLATIQAELFKWQAQIADAERQYMPNHPIVKTIQGRIDQLTVSSVAAAEQWWESSQAREDALKSSLDEAQKKSIDQDRTAVEYNRLQMEVNGLKTMDATVQGRMKEIDLIRGAGATNITILDPAQINGPPKPHKGRTLAIAMILGIIGGLGIACVRDWLDDRLRTAESIKAAIGVPVLGAVPVISSAFTAADRGQIVFHDPFGEAAESYRTLRTALQFGLPSGVKTLLITSPASGEGKSTLVSNLGIAIAQTGKRVLILDADFRAPMQHRLFGLKDRIGFSTVLGGTDTIEQAIQRTEVEGLDVLPCGPIPPNPAEMLNDQSFTDQLNDLADKYDLVLIDSPPVTAVADARILGAGADATLLVIRPEGSTRRQTEDARDGLRSVGARVIGVAVNGAAKSGGFSGGASGYYSRLEPIRSGQRRGPSQDRDASKPAAGSNGGT